MSPEAFVASFALESRVSRPPRKPKPALVLVQTPAIEGPQEPVKAWAPLPGFGPFIKPNPDRKPERLEELQQTFPDAIEDPVKLARFARAQRLEGAKLAAALPGWAKAWIRAHTFPGFQEFVPNQPMRFPAWTYR